MLPVAWPTQKKKKATDKLGCVPVKYMKHEFEHAEGMAAQKLQKESVKYTSKVTWFQTPKQQILKIEKQYYCDQMSNNQSWSRAVQAKILAHGVIQFNTHKI